MPDPAPMPTFLPHLVLSDAAAAIEFYQKAFGFTEDFRMAMPDGTKVMHAQLRLGNMILYLADDMCTGNCRSPKALGGTTVTIHIDSKDVDADYARAIAAGATADMPPADMFWGARYGKLTDPFGHAWSIATHQRDVPPAEMERAAKEMFANWKP